MAAHSGGAVKTVTSKSRWWILAYLIPLPLAAQTSSPLAITHITVIDCTGADPKPNSTVLVANGRIVSVTTSDSSPIAAGTRVIDGTGKFLIPGLWDMHGHLTDATADAFPLLILNGVTGVRDLGGDLTLVDRWRAEIESGSRVGPHIFRAGPFVDGPKNARNRLTVRTPDEAR
ncbi:MAG TPA: hypothetical protein VJ840_16635, partial [Gemmatimonadaceae bacterium]|nr:hypothetical protein [Gemmatimonadaceae bacterium]